MKGKRIYKKVLLYLLVWTPLMVSAQTAKRITPDEYIASYKELAVAEMKRTSIPASITLSQGLLESGNGNSRLAKEANNHFGIKCKKDWPGRSINVDDDAPQECFRAYDKAEDSYADHSDFLSKGDRYAFLFDLDPLDYKEWAKGLKQAGYATNPRYADLLIEVIERYKLYEYDKGNVRRKKDGQKEEDPQPLIADKDKSEKDKEEKFTYNGIPAYVVKTGDTYESITRARGMMRFEIRKYNDLNKSDVLEAGTIIYLKPKKRKGNEEFHLVKEGESMYYISQLHLIKLKHLYKKNRMKPGQEPLAGEKLFLRDKRDNSPALHPNPTFAAKKRGLKLEEQKQPETPVNPAKDMRNKPVEIVAKPNDLPKKEPLAVVKDEKTVVNNNNPSPAVVAEKNVAADKKVVPQRKDLLANVDTLLPQKMEATLQMLEEKTDVENNDVVAENKVSENKPKTDTRPNIYSNNNTAQKTQNKPEVKPNTQHVTNSVSAKTATMHTVQSGETLFSISRKYNTSVEKIKELNQLKENAISLGQTLKVSEGTDAGIQQAQLPEQTYHEVRQGESLYGISKKYGLTVEQLKQLNGLDDNSLNAGQKLRIK